jgi:RNA recognition motif-containing protein
MNKKLFIASLSWSVTEDQLVDLFTSVGEVVDVRIPRRREDGKPRGFAFVEMGTPEQAQAAIDQFNGVAVAGREVVVMFQDPNREQGRAPGGPGGGGAGRPPRRDGGGGYGGGGGGRY